jgi:hypothetical protein
METENLLIDHLDRSYKNAQEVIRFIDTKNGGITGLSVILLGGALSVAHFFLSSIPPYFKFFPFAICNIGSVAGVAFFASFIAFISCIFFAARSVLARPPILRSTVLFPYGDANAFIVARTELENKAFTQSIPDEYYIQLQTLAGILAQKLPNSRRASIALIWQLTFTVIFSLLGLFFTGRI